MSLCKYYKQKKEVSYDSGATWQDVAPAEYRIGDLYEMDSPDCREGETIIRWRLVPGDYLCEGKDKYQKEIEQYSTDNGITWRNIYPSTFRKGNLIESNSSVCDNKWEGHYTEYGQPGLCPMWYKWVDGIGCVYVDPIKFVRCTTSSSTTLTHSDIYYASYNLIYGYIGDCVTSIGSSAFDGCGSLTSINIPNSVTSIGNSAFTSCYSLTSIDIPNSVTSIGNSAFYYCISITSCTIGSGVTSIGATAFGNCTGLTSVTVNATTPPTLGIDVFYQTNDCPIYVPAASVETYKAAIRWSDYASRIQAIP